MYICLIVYVCVHTQYTRTHTQRYTYLNTYVCVSSGLVVASRSGFHVIGLGGSRSEVGDWGFCCWSHGYVEFVVVLEGFGCGSKSRPQEVAWSF